jgi:predicted transcriptional regulator
MLRWRREALGISREKLAWKVGCSSSYVQMLESGFQPARSDVLPRLLAVLDELEEVTPEDELVDAGQPPAA